MPKLVRRSVVHGRVRWYAPTLDHQPRRSIVVEDALGALVGVRSAQANPSTGSLLIHYDPALTDVTELESAARAALMLPPLDAEAWQRRLATREHAVACGHDGHHEHDHHGDACGHGHDGDDLTERVRNLWLGGAALGSALLRRLILGSGVLAGPPWLTAIVGVCTLVTGWPFLKGAWRTLAERRRLTTDTLVSSATVASIFLGEGVTALTVIWLLNLGEYLQSVVLRRTRRAIRALLELEETDVWLVVGDVEVSTSVDRLALGDLVVVHAGKRIPVDGRVDEGTGTVNEAPITGESIPAMRNAGDQVYAGTILLAGRIRIRVERVGADTAVGRLIERVEQAQESRAPIQTIGDRFSMRFVPASFALAALVLLAHRRPSAGAHDAARGLPLRLRAGDTDGGERRHRQTAPGAASSSRADVRSRLRRMSTRWSSTRRAR